MRRTLATLATLATVLSIPAAVDAGHKPVPTGTIVIDQPAPYRYGDTVTFTATVVGAHEDEYEQIFVHVVCLQAGRIVYQSGLQLGGAHLLVDKAGDNLHWDGTTAECVGQLVHLEQQGKLIWYSTLAETPWFTVGP
jgi:hypothetical protein